jgi:glycosyltransferase involved in cell wall biosynthesis
MKILTVVVNLNKGGTQRAAQAFAEGYLQLQHDSRILALKGLGPRFDEIKDSIPVWEGLNSANYKAIKNWNPDIVHIHSHGPEESDIRPLVEICKNAKVIETNVFSKPSPWADLVDISFQLSQWAQWLFNLRGGSKYKSAIVPNPLKLESFNRAEPEKIKEFRSIHAIPEDAFVIGRVGQSTDGKWSEYLFEAFGEVVELIPNAFLILVNPPRNLLEKSLLCSFKNRIIHIPKIIGDANLSVAYSSFDVMLHIALQGESFGMVFPECIMCGTPVITLNTPWGDNSQGEVIGHKIGGYVVNNKKNLSKTIIKLYQKEINFHPEIAVNHIERFDFLNVSKKALELVSNLGKANHEIIKQPSKLLTKAIDKPTWLTLLLIYMNNNYLRKLTLYSTGYKGLKEIIISIGSKRIKST